MATGNYGSDNRGSGQGSFNGYGAQGSSCSPFLRKWDKAPVLPAVAGCVISLFVWSFSNAIDRVMASYPTETASSSDAGTIGVIFVISLVMAAISIVYAAYVYPSLFKERNAPSSPGLVSFLNFLLGGPIFGALWNHNLTLKTPGMSHKVYVALVIVAIVCGFLSGLA